MTPPVKSSTHKNTASYQHHVLTHVVSLHIYLALTYPFVSSASILIVTEHNLLKLLALLFVLPVHIATLSYAYNLEANCFLLLQGQFHAREKRLRYSFQL